MSLHHILSWLSVALNFVSLLWMGWLAYRHEQRDVAFWWIAGAFAMGGVADILAFLGLGWETVSHVYPVGQSALIAAVLLDKHTALWLLCGLGWASFLSLLVFPTHTDVPLHTAAWGSLAWIGWRAKGCPFRPVLLWAFGAALLAWYWFAWTRSLESWLALQGCYAVGLGWFCLAASRTRNGLKAVG